MIYWFLKITSLIFVSCKCVRCICLHLWVYSIHFNEMWIAKSFLLTFNLLSINFFFCFNNQVLNVLIQNSSEIREIKKKPVFVFIPLFQFSYHILQSIGYHCLNGLCLVYVVYGAIPSQKEDTKVWHKKGEPSPKKCRMDRWTKKILCTLFWDSKGVLYVHFAEGGGKKGRMNSATYDSLKKRIKGKRPGLLWAEVISQHDNTTPHTLWMTKKKIEDLLWEVFMHPANSPDLAPLNYHPFPALKKFLGEKQFTNDEELKTTICQWMKDVGTQFYADSINKLVHRYEKCVQVGGDYMEK